MKGSELTDEQIEALLDRVMGTREAEAVGLIFEPSDQYPHLRYTFARDTDLDHPGFWGLGDYVTAERFRLAVDGVIAVRGNHRENADVAKAYWDIVRNPCTEWTPATIVMLAAFSNLHAGPDESLS